MSGLPEFARVPQTTEALKAKKRNDFTDGLTVLNPDLDKEIFRALQSVPTAELVTPPVLAAKPVSIKNRAIESFDSKVMLFSSLGAAFTVIGQESGGMFVVSGCLFFASGTSQAVANFTRSGKVGKVEALVRNHAVSGYIRTEWLRREYVRLVKGSHSAYQDILAARVVKDDKVDRARIESSFPQILWDIAHTLHEVSVLREEMQEAAGDTKITSTQAETLQEVVRKMVERVQVLFQCAKDIEAADKAYENLLAADAIEGFDSRILNLLARTTGDAVEVEEIKNLSQRARAVTEAYREAMDIVLDSVNAALELEK